MIGKSVEPRQSDARAYSFNHYSTLYDLNEYKQVLHDVVFMIRVSLEGRKLTLASLGVRLAEPVPSVAQTCMG